MKILLHSCCRFRLVAKGCLVLLLVSLSSPSLAETPMCQMLVCTIVGTEGDDRLSGTRGDDVICGLGGNDVLAGRAGDDLICGGAGDDLLDGGKGNDILVGGPGADTLRGNSGKDSMFDYQGDNTTDAGGEDETLQTTTSSVTSESTQRFSTSDNTIYAPDGSVFEARGVNIFPWHMTERDIDGIVDCWKFNLVRLHSWILPRMTSPWKDHLVFIDEPRLFDPNQSEFRTYDIAPLIDAYTARGIVVVIDIHDLIGQYFVGQDLADYLQFAEQLANRYKDNPYVWFDIHNEPGSWDGQNLDFTEWRTQMPLILDTVRAIAPDMMLIVSGAAWGQDTGPHWGHALVDPDKSALLANSDIIQGYDKLIATYHMYDQWTFGADRVRDFVDKLLAASDAPIFVGEYGSDNGGDTLSAAEYLHQLVDIPEYARVGRSVWTWSAHDANDLVAEGDGSGYRVDSCAVPSNLTLLGQLVWDDNHGL